jgi:hypothetical protein
MLVVHNMSAPPRTEVRAEKRGIADRIVVFSLQYALIASGFLEAPAGLNCCRPCNTSLRSSNNSQPNVAVTSFLSPTARSGTRRPFCRQFPGTHSPFIVSESTMRSTKHSSANWPVNGGEPAFC